MPRTDPTFDTLMAEGATPRRTPVLDTPAVTAAVLDWFGNKAKWRTATAEMALPNDQRADVIALNRTDHEFYIIEVKTKWNDFMRDRKFFTYRQWCDWFAFAVPEELAACARKRMDMVPGWYEGVGLLVIPNDFSPRRMVRRPTQSKMVHEDYVKMLERWGQSCWGRIFDLRSDLAAHKLWLKNAHSDITQLKKRLGDPNPNLYGPGRPISTRRIEKALE